MKFCPKLFEFRWDESEKHIQALDTTKSHIWASSTLYSEEWQQKRKHWFADWGKANDEVNQDTVLDFHKNAGEGNPQFDVVMNRENIVRTTSITSIVKKEVQFEMRYEDILNGEIEEGTLQLEKIKA